MDFMAILEQYIAVVVVIGCLVVGYIIKHASFMKWLPNGDIPAVLALVGAVLNVIYAGLTLDTVVFGAFMGLASTGLHQAFKKFVEKTETE